MAVTVVTDSAATLPSDLAGRGGVRVVPLWLHLGDDSFRDNDLALTELLDRDDRPFSSAAPSPGEFADVIESAGREGPVLVLTVASTMSSTHAAAVLGARQADAEVTVVDTQTAAGAQGLVVLAAAAAANAGAHLGAVADVARQVIERVRLIATVADLTRLARSGRLPEAARRVGERVGVQPLFELRRGRVRPMRPALSRGAALDRIVDRCAADRRSGDLHVAVLHALDPAAAATLERRVSALRPATCFVGPFSAVMTAHTGAGLAGLAWWREP